MTAKHTPGPWVVIPMPDGSIDICKSNAGYHIAQMLYTGYPADVQANASLIAAAPDLLTALELLQSATKHYFRDFDHLHPSIGEPLALAASAIAKARGE